MFAGSGGGIHFLRAGQQPPLGGELLTRFLASPRLFSPRLSSPRSLARRRSSTAVPPQQARVRSDRGAASARPSTSQPTPPQP